MVVSGIACTQNIVVEQAEGLTHSELSLRNRWFSPNHFIVEPLLQLEKPHLLSLLLSSEITGIQVFHQDELLREHSWQTLPSEYSVARTIRLSEAHPITQLRLLSETTSRSGLLHAKISANAPNYYLYDSAQIRIPSTWDILNTVEDTQQSLEFVFREPLETPKSIRLRVHPPKTMPVTLALFGDSQVQEYQLLASPEGTFFALNIIPRNVERAVVSISKSTESSSLSDENAFPLISFFEVETEALAQLPEPIDADMEYMLRNPPEQWRSPTAEFYRWGSFANIFVLVSETRAIQRRYFARLAFFVEKRGFRGRILTDAELSGRHGWNAHNYHSSDLAAFFSVVPEGLLTPEEKHLRGLLIHNNIIQTSTDGFQSSSSETGILGVSWDLGDRIRRLLLGHEALHGLYYEEPEFQAFVDEQWQGLDDDVKQFFQFMFSAYSYDGGFLPLVKNEMQAYLLQQPVDTFPTALTSIAARLKQYRPHQAAYVDTFFKQHRQTLIDLSRQFNDFINGRYGISAGAIQRVIYEQ